MSWEWVAPVVTGVSGCVGVFFTWLAGAQARAHTERMLQRTREDEQRAWLFKERRDAYLAALRVIDLDLRRARYNREGKLDKLRQIDGFWPKGERVRTSMEAVIAVSTFGSSRARTFAAEWAAALDAEDEQTPVRAAERIRDQVRRELNPTPDN